ncbi:hypothetical protein LJ707_08770 [Mucilaginibacter sp. UR6-1]|uniref:hypothetical protein n=1 Tax=Mucilaginibacter sp. UR6-1 TaxID=1435643 RepID=UPI001E4271B5|nr:hypothetical protein [Mucilaginibacter sp. UR6-1]MCC8409021.1 hypothetical protein [Mucilaginibacter sp. UR6-1]
MNWISENKEILFGGILAAIVGAVITVIFQKTVKSKSSKQSLKSGSNSKNIQVGRDYNQKP